MNSAYTVDLFNAGQTPQVPATRFWAESHGRQPEKSFGLFEVARVAGLAISLALSPITVITDPWLKERRQRDSVVTVSIYKEVLGRFISRAEALRIASQILERAEQERLMVAEYEAARGMQWENQP